MCLAHLMESLLAAYESVLLRLVCRGDTNCSQQKTERKHNIPMKCFYLLRLIIMNLVMVGESLVTSTIYNQITRPSLVLPTEVDLWSICAWWKWCCVSVSMVVSRSWMGDLYPIPGSEAMFADLGHFSELSIKSMQSLGLELRILRPQACKIYRGPWRRRILFELM